MARSREAGEEGCTRRIPRTTCGTLGCIFFFIDSSSSGNRFQMWIGPYSVVDSMPISHCKKVLLLDVHFVLVIKELEHAFFQAGTLGFTHDHSLVSRHTRVVGISKICRTCGQRRITKLGCYNNTVAVIYNATLCCRQMPRKERRRKYGHIL